MPEEVEGKASRAPCALVPAEAGWGEVLKGLLVEQADGEEDALWRRWRCRERDAGF